MKPLALMRRQITAAKVFDGDQMEAELQVSLPQAGSDGDLADPGRGGGLIRHESTKTTQQHLPGSSWLLSLSTGPAEKQRDKDAEGKGRPVSDKA